MGEQSRLAGTKVIPMWKGLEMLGREGCPGPW